MSARRPTLAKAVAELRAEGRLALQPTVNRIARHRWPIRLIAVIAIIGVGASCLMTTTATAFPWSPRHGQLTTEPANCPQQGAPDGVIPGIPVIKVWDFSEPPGSTAAHEGLHNSSSDILRITAPYTGVTFSGASAGFADNGLLTTSGANLQPGTRPFSVCVGYLINPGEYLWNLVQWSNSTATNGGHDPGFVKVAGVYVRAQGANASAKVPCVADGNTLVGSGYHTDSLVVRPSGADTWVACIHDGVVYSNVKVVGGLGAVNLDGVMSVGGKNPYADGHLISPTDLLNGRVARIMVGIG